MSTARITQDDYPRAMDRAHLSLMGTSLCGGEGRLSTERDHVTCPHCRLLIEVDRRRRERENGEPA